MIGTTLGSYEILDKLGAGGMGVVYRARDERLGRQVAIKMLPADLSGDETEALERLRREATLLASLNHPNVATIHAIEEGPDGPFLVLEYVAGECLAERLRSATVGGAPGGLLPREAVRICLEIARGIAAAHDEGIVHRDLKPANVMIRPDGSAKVLDFGIGKVAFPAVVGDEDETAAALQLTTEGTLMGTIPYMSPEAVRGRTADERADIWALGCLLYEMLTGHTPFARDTVADTLSAILEQQPERVTAPEVSDTIIGVLDRCLEKDPANRPASMHEVVADLAGAADLGHGTSATRPSRRWKWIAVGAAVAAMAALAVAGVALNQINVRWARNEALPRIVMLIGEGRYADAVELAEQAERSIGGAVDLEELWPRMARDVQITATPSDARVSISAVRRPRFVGESVFGLGEWTDLGRTPIELRRLPLGSYRVRVEEPGFRTRETIASNDVDDAGAANEWRLLLARSGRVPDGMVSLGLRKLRANLRGLDDYDPEPERQRNARYLIGRFEVTNAEFKRFVDAGGYSDRQYWQHSFARDGAESSWQEAMGEFRDTTGRPGPATWEGGTYAPGQESYPVTGVSWFEAAAYAEFASASLPTIYHWLGARGDDFDMAAFGNFRGEGPLPVGTSEFGPYGIYDLAGNVREWTHNAAGDMRFILGGGWTDPGYVLYNGDVAPPWDRSPRNGIRLVDHSGVSAEELAALQAPVEPEFNAGAWDAAPASADVFEVLADHYAYDPAPLAARVDAVDESSPYWIKETVSFETPYGERMSAYLFLPRNVAPPFQTLLFFPGAGAIGELSSVVLQGMDMIAHVLKSGRAVMYPVYTSTYERFDGNPGNGRSRTRAYVDRKARWVQDARRALDYLETRAEVDAQRTGYWGLSWGAEISPITLAVDDRLGAGVLMDGGAVLDAVLAEADEANFAPRVIVPILMINGRYDYIFPVEATQLPLLELLGTPAADKTHLLFDTGHIVAASRFDEAMSGMVNWLDLTFGPVR